MLTDYINAAMHKATYTFLEDNTFFGEIPELEGLWSNATTLEACRDELAERLEEWLLAGLRLGHPIPVINEIDLNIDFEKEDVA